MNGHSAKEEQQYKGEGKKTKESIPFILKHSISLLKVFAISEMAGIRYQSFSFYAPLGCIAPHKETQITTIQYTRQNIRANITFNRHVT